MGDATGNTMYKINDAVSVEVSKIASCTLPEFMNYFQVTLMNPKEMCIRDRVEGLTTIRLRL